MDSFIIEGGHPLSGHINISGGKNSSLPILCTCLLTKETVHLKNIPRLQDIDFMLKILSEMGVQNSFENNEVTLTPNKVTPIAEYDLVRKMRASILVLGPLLAHYGEAKVSLPGGCAIGARPIDIHLEGLQKLGAEIFLEAGYVSAKADKLIGADIKLPFPSVGATENLLMASTLAEGTTKIIGAAKEPEIVELAHCLISMGAKIEGAGTDSITIEGVSELGAGNYTILPDRIETATFLIAGAITKSPISVSDYPSWVLLEVEKALEQMGHKLQRENNKVNIIPTENPKPLHIVTEPFPGFPTDVQAQLMTLMCLTPGESSMMETIFENRFMHVPELIRMGADIKLDGNLAIINGVSALSGAPVMATDLRASASLVIAALAAIGETKIARVYHIDRGYQEIEKKLSSLGANIKRVRD